MTNLQPPLSSTRAAIVARARAWIGTPYHHQASTLGAGTDCLGLVRGIWRDLHGTDPEPLPAYSRDWAEATGAETMLDAARRHLIEIAPAAARPGDILIFRFRVGTVAKHAAVLATATTIVHAVEGASVAEVPFGSWWRRRIAGAFSFPRIID